MEDVRLIQAVPQVFVSDIAASCAYYRDRLGFTVLFTYGTPPYYAHVARDGVRLALRHVDQPPMDKQAVARDDLLSAYIEVTGVAALFQACMAAGAGLHQKLRQEPWGERSFIARDPDGNLVLFAGP